ncbi:MAG: phosphoribosyl-AMP cyclohydrolase [Candidatus Omnitrophota bacterium]
MGKFISSLKFDDNGLIPAIIQDYKNNEVLMMAFMNKEAVEKTLKTKKTHFYSRSRKKLWLKGETSGHIQKVKEIRFDCDCDCLLVKALQVGGACHTGFRSCFYRKLKDEKGNFRISGKLIFKPDEVYHASKEPKKQR